MRKSSTCRSILSVVVLAIATCNSAADVKDHAEMFSKKAIDEANGQIDLLKEKRKKDLVVETYKTVPDEKRDEIKRMDARAKDEFFVQWAAERARQLELDGIYVLITKEPTYVFVAAGPETLKKAFTSENLKALRKLLVERFKARQFDRGLLEGTSFVRETVKGNLKDAANPDQGAAGGFDWKGLLCTAVIALGVIWLVMAVIRGFSGSGAAGAGSALGGGGGGFMSGMLGGLFGAVAGNWLYHSMFGGHSGGLGGSSANADEAQGGDAGASDEGRDFTGSGGDYGDSGGDAGGGGDWGGGGGDWGGGGGDY